MKGNLVFRSLAYMHIFTSKFVGSESAVRMQYIETMISMQDVPAAVNVNATLDLGWWAFYPSLLPIYDTNEALLGMIKCSPLQK